MSNQTKHHCIIGNRKQAPAPAVLWYWDWVPYLIIQCLMCSVCRTDKYIYIFHSHHTNSTPLQCAIILRRTRRVTCDFWKNWFGPHDYCLWLQDGIAGKHGYRLRSAKISMNQLREPTAETGWESILWRVQQSSSRPAWSHNLTEMTDRY